MDLDIDKIVDQLRLMSDNGEFDDAIKLETESLERQPDAELYCQRGQLYELVAQPLKAIDDFTFAANAKPEHFRYFLFRGEDYALLGQNPDAIRDYRRVLELKPDCPNIHQQLGYVYLRAGQIAEAEEQVRLALSKEPADWYTYVVQAEVRLKQGEFEAAHQSYLKAISHSDTGWAGCAVATCWAGVARALRRTELPSNLQRALKAASTAVDLDPIWLELRAAIHRQLGDRRNAISDLETALSHTQEQDAINRIISEIAALKRSEKNDE